MERKKIILYVIIGVILLLLMFSSFDMIRFNNTGENSGSNSINGNIPEKCRKPDGQDLESWKAHLSHHQNTLYCLDYYK